MSKKGYLPLVITYILIAIIFLILFVYPFLAPNFKDIAPLDYDDNSGVYSVQLPLEEGSTKDA